MEKTENLNFNLPQPEDRVKIDDLNQNTKGIDYELSRLEVISNSKAPIHSPKFSGEPVIQKVKENNEFKDEPILTSSDLEYALEVEDLDN